MSTKLMDATPDLKRLAPVENLAIDVISYAHGSVTPTLTHLYSKGKDSFLKVRRRYFVVNGETHKNAQRGAFLFSFFLSFSLVFVEHTKDTRDACAWIYVGRFKCTQCDDLCASVNGLFNKSFSSRRLEFRFIIDFFFLCGCNTRATQIFSSSSSLKKTPKRRRRPFFCGVAGWCVAVSISRRTNETISHSWTNKRRGLSTPSKGWLLRTARQ